MSIACDSDSWDGIIKKLGVGKCNSNGLLLLQTYAEHDLLITNTIFCLPNRKNTSWMHPHSKHWHLIDYVIVRRKDKQDVRVAKPICGAKCCTDHCPIISKLNLHTQPLRRPQGKKTLKRLAINKLNSNDVKQLLTDSLDKQLESVSLENQKVETAWSTLCETVYNIAYKCLGPSIKKHKDWFDENCSEISQLLEEKQSVHKALLDEPSSAAKKQALNLVRKTIQQRLHHMQDSLLSKKVNEIQGFANKNNMKNFYSGLKEIYGHTTSGTSPHLNIDRTALITDKEDILKRWANHFDSILNCPSVISSEATTEPLDIKPIREELLKAISQLSSGKAPGSDSIPAKIYEMVAQLLSFESYSSSDPCGNRKRFLRISRMLLAFTRTST